ncbi:hypothetical protein HED60_18770 [Planctomycetales bacterium ZRK34]|nr:hypothetical protein HED60_18770 [Planctomycetales bacterium ZRK34]
MKRFALLIVPALLLTGCQYVDELKLPVLTTEGKTIEPETAADTATGLAPQYYPAEAETAEPLDVEIVRVGNAIRFDNRTINEYRDVEIWLNQQYGAHIDHIAIGHNQPISLKSFVNQYGEIYPVARFLAPDADQALVLGDMLKDGKIHKLTVRLRNDWRRP